MRVFLNIVRILLWLLAAALLAGGVSCFKDASSMKRDLQAKQQATPLDMAIDLSRPGEWSAAMPMKWRGNDGLIIHLVLPDGRPEGSTTAGLIAGLKMRWWVTDATGDVVDEHELVIEHEPAEDSSWHRMPKDGPIALGSSRSIKGMGDYAFHAVIEQGAPALAGLSQRIESSYWIIGLEGVAPLVTSIFGTVALVSAIVLSFVAWFTGKRLKARQSSLPDS